MYLGDREACTSLILLCLKKAKFSADLIIQPMPFGVLNGLDNPRHLQARVEEVRLRDLARKACAQNTHLGTL